MDNHTAPLDTFLTSSLKSLLLHNTCQKALANFPAEIIDCVITSPPYWKMRDYRVSEDENTEEFIGNEKQIAEYVQKLLKVFSEVHRVLKKDGSLWLNLGDKYHGKKLVGAPWRVAIALQDQGGWILRNDVIWNQRKGTQSAKDRLRDMYEHLFHFVKQKNYYYDADAIRIKSSKKVIIDGDRVISATGVSGDKYRSQIKDSTTLSDLEKQAALNALNHVIEEVRRGEIIDYRMTIRGQQRTYHSDSVKVSGRAKELLDRGYFFLKSRAKGHLPGDIWDIVPEDTWRKDSHYAVFPIDLLRVPILATSRPTTGIILDPFAGTASAVAAATTLGRRGIGIEASRHYIQVAQKRLSEKLS